MSLTFPCVKVWIKKLRYEARCEGDMVIKVAPTLEGELSPLMRVLYGTPLKWKTALSISTEYGRFAVNAFKIAINIANQIRDETVDVNDKEKLTVLRDELVT